MTIYEELIFKVYNGETFHINFKDKMMKIGSKRIINEGVYDNERTLIEFDGDVFDMIENLYHSYKYSTPSERSDRKKRCYFKALSSYELTDEELIFGEQREVARAKLEGFILCMMLQNRLVWPDQNKWFWQGSDEDLVIIKNWLN